jgi:peptidoglycan/xylan/chitin deacetylase (PgdA/CDA1 family)
MFRYCFLRYPGGKGKAVTLSYDDGVRFDVPLARIIEKYGIKCTFNLNTGFMTEDRKENKLMPEEVQAELLDHGHEVAVHGKFHRAPGLCRPFEVAADVMDCRRELEEMFGMIIRGMAYPDSGILVMMGGNTLEDISRRLSELGIAYSRTLAGDNDSFMLPNNWYAWMPTCHHNNPNLMPWLEKFLTEPMNHYLAVRFPKVFYVWGHTYEFRNDNNWEVLENFCKRASGHEDVWYATNIEICEYMKAYEQLLFNVDNTMVYNPTNTTIWFEVDGDDYKIEPGQTINVVNKYCPQ